MTCNINFFSHFTDHTNMPAKDLGFFMWYTIVVINVILLKKIREFTVNLFLVGLGYLEPLCIVAAAQSVAARAAASRHILFLEQWINRFIGLNT